MTVSPFKEGWLELAAEWTNLARETEAKPHFSMAADQLVPQQYYDIGDSLTHFQRIWTLIRFHFRKQDAP